MRRKIQQTIEYLRRQPHETRHHVINTLMIFFSIVLFAFWTWSLGADVKSPETASRFKEDLQPFMELSDDLTASTGTLILRDQGGE